MSPRLNLPKLNLSWPKLGAIAFTLLTIGYPLFIYFALQHFPARLVALCTAVLLSLRLLWVWKKKSAEKNNTSNSSNHLYIALTLAVLCAVISTMLNHIGAIRLIPVVINSAFLVAFSNTLWNPPTMIERFSRMGNPNPTPRIIAYTRVVTIVWCLFFLCNGLIALYTALYSSMEIWTLYNGLISYILMGLLFAGEYIIRLRVKANDAANVRASA